jgi:dTMP kinase
MYKYPVIVFEGIETSGKSTNLKIVAKYLNNINRKFIKIREPGGTTLSEIFRKLILNKKSKLNFKTDLMLIMASRSENIDKIIKNNYGKKIIIIDRFVDSTIAYQHYGMGINLNLINKLNNFLLDRFKPTFTFLSIVNKKNMKIRLNKRFSLNKYDKFDLSFYNKVQKGFLNISKDKKNYFIIDSNENNIEENSQIIIKKIKKLVS